jgi:uncharacterized damage-inducible protein DinB
LYLQHFPSTHVLGYDCAALRAEAMNINDIETLYAYNRWANQRMFSTLEKLSDEQFTREIQSSFPSIQETVFHIMFAEWIWLKRWKGASPRTNVADPNASSATWNALVPPGTPPAEELKTVEALKSFANSIDQERQEFLRGVDDAALQATHNFTDLSGDPQSGPLAQLLQHVVNHGSYHRGQVTTLLRQAGGEPVGLDMRYFFREQSSK